MEFEGRKIDLRKADHRCAEPKQQHDPEIVGVEEFDAQLEQLIVQDDEGCWWVKGRKANEWLYRDESGWVRDMPPGRLPPAEEASGNRCDSNRPSRLPRRVSYEMYARSSRTPNRMNGPSANGPDNSLTRIKPGDGADPRGPDAGRRRARSAPRAQKGCVNDEQTLRQL